MKNLKKLKTLMILSLSLLICSCLSREMIIREKPDYTDRYKKAKNENELFFEAKNNIVDLEKYIDILVKQILSVNGNRIKVVDLRVK